MKYRLQITKDYRGTNYTPQVLKWPSWLGVWKSILSDGRETSSDIGFLFEYEAIEAINNHKRQQSSTVTTYKYYID